MIVLAKHDRYKRQDYRLLPDDAEGSCLKLQELIRILEDIQDRFGAGDAIVKTGIWDDNAYDGSAASGVRFIKDDTEQGEEVETVFIMAD